MVISLLKRGAALLTLLALVAGAPYLLWVLGKDLLPDHVPGLSDVWDSLTAQDTGALFMGALVLAGFIAWAVFTLCVLIDIAGRITGRTWTLRIPGLRVPQAAASSLISAVLAGSALLGVTGTATAAAPLPPLPPAAAAAVAVPAAHLEEAQQHTLPTPITTAPASTPVGPVWTVREGDTLWSIAEKTTGDPLRYQEIFELNHATVQPDGGRLDTPETWLEVGWTLRLPAGAATAAPPGAVQAPADPAPVLVQPGDTLSQIAQDELGDATRYPELASANKITDPDVIDVGQVIVIPQPTPGAAVGPVPPAGTEPATSSPTPAAQPQEAVPADPESAGEAQVPPQPRSPGETPAAGSRSAASSAAVSTPAEQPIGSATAASSAPASVSQAAESAQSAAAASDSGDHGSIAVLAGVTALTASAGWLALLAARRRGHRRRSPGRQAAPARLGAARAERRLREKAGTADAGWLDTALRCLAVTLSSQPAAGYPDVVAAYVGAHQLRLQLAEPTPAPAPFEADRDEWVLPVTADLSVTDTAAAECMAPLPTLASIGSRGDQTVLLDLERAGAVCLQGDRRACRELMNHLVLELAHNGWSDGLTVSLVGWGEALTVLNPERLVPAASIADVIRDLRARLAETRDSEASLGTTVLAGRVGDVAGDSWMPQVLLIDATDDDQQIVTLQQILGEMAQAGRATTAVVMTGAPSVGGVAEITVTAEGELRFPELWGPARLTAARLGDTEIGELAELFHVAEHVDEPIPAAAEEESWAQGMDASGALLDPVAAPDPHQGTDSGTAENGAAAAGNSAADDATGDAAQSAARVVPVRPISPAAAAQLTSVLAADPDLDADLAEWASETVLRAADRDGDRLGVGGAAGGGGCPACDVPDGGRGGCPGRAGRPGRRRRRRPGSLRCRGGCGWPRTARW